MARLGVSLVFVAALLTACSSQNKTDSAHVEEPYTPSTTTPYGSDPAYTANTGAYDTASSGGSNYSSLDSMEQTPAPASAAPANSATYGSSSGDQTLAPSSGRTYVVAKGDTFYKLARQFYSNQSRWRDIWNANKSRVPNPDHLPIGTKLIIP